MKAGVLLTRWRPVLGVVAMCVFAFSLTLRGAPVDGESGEGTRPVQNARAGAPHSESAAWQAPWRSVRRRRRTGRPLPLAVLRPAVWAACRTKTAPTANRARTTSARRANVSAATTTVKAVTKR